MERFIDPRTLARVKDLPLVAKAVAEGFLQGLQNSMQRGVGMEFSQYRPYEDGDDINRVDWKLFARSDRYFVREAERESEIDVWFVLDASGSMLQKTSQIVEPNNHWNKFEYAKHLIASISYLAQKQGDSIGYLGLSSSSLNFQSCGNGERHWQRLLLSLAATASGNYFPDIQLLQRHIAQLQNPSIIFVISDFYQQQHEITDFMSQLNSTLCEIVAIQLVCEDEIKFNYNGAIRFKDLETNEEVLVSANDVKSNYLKNYTRYQQTLDKLLTQQNIQLHSFNIDQPMDEILFEYLRQRQRLK